MRYHHGGAGRERGAMNLPEHSPLTTGSAKRESRRPYQSPTITARGRVEDITRWIATRTRRPGVPGVNWNPWQLPGAGS
jgi:hypothetical protein